MSNQYRGIDGDIWERNGDLATLVEVQHPADQCLIGAVGYTNVPFSEAERIHGLVKIEDDAR